MESTNLWHLLAVIPLHDSLTTFHNSFTFLGFASETAFLTSPHKFSIGLRSGDWAGHSITLILLVWNHEFTSVFGVIVLLKQPFQGHVLFSIGQHDLFKYFNICKLIHDPWYAINRPNTIVGETCPYHDACTTMLHCLHCVLWLEFRVWGSSHKLSVALGPKKNNFTLISPQNVPPFLFRPVDVFFGKL